MNITVVIPSYRRPELLRHCIDALAKQTRLPEEVIVVLRDTDQESREAFARIAAAVDLPLRLALVRRPGPLPPVNTGFELATGDIVCITDDDAQPFPDWLARIEARFLEDPAVGAVGGRDFVHFGGVPAPTRKVDVVGKIQWFGRSIGNHSNDSAGYREVDCLKGCNMAFRKDVDLRCDERLRGDAYQYEVGVCLRIKAKGRKIMFDPEIRVNHFLAERKFGTGRAGLTPERLANNSHNHLLVRRATFPPLRMLVYLIYTFGVGDQETPGLLKALHLARGNPVAAARILAPSLRGKVAGLFAGHHASR